MFRIPLNCANGGNERIIAVGKEPLYAYDNDKNAYTTEEIGVKYDVVLQSNRYQEISVKVKGTDPLPKLTTEAIQSANDGGAPILLVFKGGEVKFSAFNGREQISATATSVEIASKTPVNSFESLGVLATPAKS